MEISDEKRNSLARRLGFFNGISSVYTFLIKNKDNPDLILGKRLNKENLEILGYSKEGLRMMNFSNQTLEKLYSNFSNEQTTNKNYTNY